MQASICRGFYFSLRRSHRVTQRIQCLTSVQGAILKQCSKGNNENTNSLPSSSSSSSSSSKEVNFNVDEMILNSSSSGEHQDDFGQIEYEDEEYLNDDDIASEILNVALQFVPKYGWSDHAIEEAVKSLDLSPSSAGMFKRGGVDLLIHFIEECNNALSDSMIDLKKDTNLSQSAILEESIKTRLKMIIPYIETWPQALTLLASPMVAPDCLEHGAHMIDEMWYHAGDKSADMSWYTKRAALAAVYASTELFMLRDNSVDFEDTWDFLHRRIEEFKAAKVAKDSFAHSMTDFYALACAGFTTAQNILGMNRKAR